MKDSLLLLPILFFQSCHSQTIKKIKTNHDNNTLLWEITGKGLAEPSYLYGTFHMMCKNDILFSDNLKLALKNSGEVYFEIDLDDPANTLGALFFINMKDDKVLKDLYTEEEYNRVESFFRDSLKTGMVMLQRMKPNFLQALLYPKMMPCKNMSGVEEELMALAKKDKKELRGFETVEFQASVFDSIPYREQAKDLLNMIDSISIYTKYFDTMLTAYKKQQLSAIEEMFNNPAFGINDKSQDFLLDKRNENWVHQLKTILPEKNIFIAVGAGHLIGKNGLISLLRKEGYLLRPLQN